MVKREIPIIDGNPNIMDWFVEEDVIYIKRLECADIVRSMAAPQVLSCLFTAEQLHIIEKRKESRVFKTEMVATSSTSSSVIQKELEPSSSSSIVVAASSSSKSSTKKKRQSRLSMRVNKHCSALSQH